LLYNDSKNVDGFTKHLAYWNAPAGLSVPIEPAGTAGGSLVRPNRTKTHLIMYSYLFARN
jgi:hypothetical protein